VVGTDEGLYSIMIGSVDDGKTLAFVAADIPLSSTTIHEYSIDWDALSQDEEGVIVQIDSNGDGEFERTITADNELTVDEFWPYSFEDSERGTKLRINTFDKTFQFVSLEKEFAIKEASGMRVIDLSKGSWVKYSWFNRDWRINPHGLGLDSELEYELSGCKFRERPNKLIIIRHLDEELWLSAVAVDSTDFCIVHAKDLETGTRYLLLDKCGVEDGAPMIEPPAAAFDVSTNHGRAPLMVHFSDKSSGEITSWLWDFGDGTTSTLQSPFHIYWNPGNYVVTFTVSGPGGSDTLIISDCIKVERANWWWRNSFTYPHFRH
jgi:hypothetical protein